MSISRNSRLAVSIAVLVLLISCFALLSRGTSRPSLARTKLDALNPAASKPLTTNKAAFAKASQASEERQIDDKIPKHLPFTAKLKTEKEKAFKDLKNERWVRDFELEVKNTGDKPIYFIQFDLVPDFGKAPTERTLGLTIQYGRDELVYFDTALTPQDVPIKPGEKVFLKVRDMEVEGWDHFKEVEHWPEQWSKPKKVTLEFIELSFGDGTGFDGGDGAPHERRKPEQTALPGRIDKPSKGTDTYHHLLPGLVPKRHAADKNSECMVPADSLPAHFLSAESSSAEPSECGCYI